MKMSEVTIAELKDYAHVYHGQDDNLFTAILTACKSYIRNYTGLDDLTIDEKEDLTIALFVLANEMYDNRVYAVEGKNSNLVIESILNMHTRNLL
jgi:Phage gp6-like head-tail connector protein